MRMRVQSKKFKKEMNNVIDYSLGFIEGINNGKKQFLTVLGPEVIQVLKKYIDTNARMSPELLHHVYEWYKVGSPNARLYDIQYTVSNLGLSFNSLFLDSQSRSLTSNEPFIKKAKIMEDGKTIIVRPKKSNVLVFETERGTVFTSNDVTITNPGGNVRGNFERVFDQFFLLYFSQSFLRASGIFDYLSKPVAYKKNLKQGARIGKAKGIQTGYRWIVNGAMIGSVQ